jgi:peptidoglycan/LPS O-acetylase OafA/YrhL
MTVTLLAPPRKWSRPTTVDRPDTDVPATTDLRPTDSRPTVPLPITQILRRDRYVDVLRVVALTMVLTYHVLGWSWLPVLFPSMGIMFALAGSLIAGSLDRCPGNPWAVLRRRGIRLLPPLWLFGLVALPTMLLTGWTQSPGVPLSWQTLLFWVVPISDPPGSVLGQDWVTPLWYIRSYLWFLLLSPATLWLFRRWPKRMMALPVTVVLLSMPGLLPLNGRSGDVILSIAMFGGCWMLGFAHHDQRIRALPLGRVVIGGASLMALGVAWAFTHPDPVTALDLSNIPLAGTLYSLGAVLILLRLHRSFSWMDKHVVLDKLVTVVSSRALTIYLWSGFAVFLAGPLLDRWSVTASLSQDDTPGHLRVYLAACLVLTGFVLTFGWCEDLAARRPVRLNPWPRDKRQLETLRTRKVLTLRRPAWLGELTPKRLLIVTTCLLAGAGTLSATPPFERNTLGPTNTAQAPFHNADNPRPGTGQPANTSIQLIPMTMTQRPRVLPSAAAPLARPAAPLARRTAATTKPPVQAGPATLRNTVSIARTTKPRAAARAHVAPPRAHTGRRLVRRVQPGQKGTNQPRQKQKNEYEDKDKDKRDGGQDKDKDKDNR